MNQLAAAFHTSRLHPKHNQIEFLGKKKEVKEKAGKGNMEHSFSPSQAVNPEQLAVVLLGPDG